MNKAITYAIIGVVAALAVQSADAWKDTRRAERHLGRAAAADEAPKDRTQFDCREVVSRTTTRPAGRKGARVSIQRECPHVEQMEAGECETHWFRGMRCAE